MWPWPPAIIFCLERAVWGRTAVSWVLSEERRQSVTWKTGDKLITPGLEELTHSLPLSPGGGQSPCLTSLGPHSGLRRQSMSFLEVSVFSLTLQNTCEESFSTITAVSLVSAPNKLGGLGQDSQLWKLTLCIQKMGILVPALSTSPLCHGEQ